MAATEFTIRRKVLTLFGAQFHIYNAAGGLIGFCKQKAFKLKEDIRIYTDESATEERLLIKARKAIDFSSAYDVTESQTGKNIGALQRRGLKSMIRDEWDVFDPQGTLIGKILEDSMTMALVRRFLSNLFPQTFMLNDPSGKKLASMRTHFNPFVFRMTVTVLDGCPLDPYLVMAAGLLLVAIEGRQDSD
jgi:uncharacterized protein YxjI